MRIAFFGSPSFALPSLRALAQHHEVVLTVAQPDKPAGRGMRLARPAVAAEALRLGLPLSQPPRVKGNEEFARQLASLAPDVAVTAAYGKILPASLLEIPKHGFLNVHASLLPKYRGAAPIQWAIINGEKETGISIMQTEAGLDTGPVRYVAKTPIGSDETAAELFERLAELGASALLAALELLAAGALPCHPQEESQATHAPMLRKDDGRLDWDAPARSLYDRFRGTWPWPGARFRYRGGEVKVVRMRPAEGQGAPGEVLAITDGGVEVAAGRGSILLVEVQPPGKAPMAARAWANGYGARKGVQLA